MEELLPWIKVVSVTVALGWFIWWKGTLHREIVKPAIDSVNSRIDFLESRVEKTKNYTTRYKIVLREK